MQLAVLAQTLSALEQTRSRNEMTELLASLLAEVDESQVDRVIFMLLGQLGPLYQRVDFGMAEKMVLKAIAMASGKDGAVLWQEYKQAGDMGLVAENQTIVPSESLSVADAYGELLAVAEAEGAGSQAEKVQLLASLFTKMGSLERRYVCRMVLAKMRLGFSDKTILDALAVMDGGSKSSRAVLELAYQSFPDIGKIARLVKAHGARRVMDHVTLQVGVPVMPALAQRLKTADEMISKMGKVIAEPKYDGTRVQIHFVRGKGSGVSARDVIKTYARSLEENSASFPEILTIREQLSADSIIIDAEAVGYHPETGKLLAFQETITRKRKHGIEALRRSIPLKFFCFDVLLLNGESQLHRPLHERRKLLADAVLPGTVLEIDPAFVTESADELRAFHQQQLDMGLEGAMVKQYDGVYQPGRTGWNWVKFKEVEAARGKLSDTIDGVVMGYLRGKGKRSGFGIGAFLLGVFDQKKQVYVSVAKIGTGLSDEQWREMKRRADAVFSEQQPKEYVVPVALHPDVWVEPSIVVEVAADEITKSPLHSSGFGLRFPRLVRFRDDKRIEQVTNLEELAEIK